MPPGTLRREGNLEKYKKAHPSLFLFVSFEAPGHKPCFFALLPFKVYVHQGQRILSELPQRLSATIAAAATAAAGMGRWFGGAACAPGLHRRRAGAALLAPKRDHSQRPQTRQPHRRRSRWANRLRAKEARGCVCACGLMQFCFANCMF